MVTSTMNSPLTIFCTLDFPMLLPSSRMDVKIQSTRLISSMNSAVSFV